MRNQDLNADSVQLMWLVPAYAYLVLQELVQRLHNEYVIVEVNATILHQDH